MKKVLPFDIMICFALVLSACGTPLPATPTAVSTPTSIPTPTPIPVDACKPCIGAPAPAQWHHIVVLMFENKTYDEVIGPAPYITNLSKKCAAASNWQDANSKVDGSADGVY